ncbi:zinc knuckle-domain-containing protein [Globomyces pollinis-pini]|nr:zinc knuckle-domain-containing protein [Globomyces pollinis-pini]
MSNPNGTIHSLSQLQRVRNGVSNRPGQCQKCLKLGHWTYDCKESRPYVSRPSRTKQLTKPILLKRKPLPVQLQPIKDTKGVADQILQEKQQMKEESNKRLRLDEK